MISLDNLKTVINAIKCLLTDYPKKKDIPTKLPNPNALNFTGAVTSSYDGSEALAVEIPRVPKPLTYGYMPEGYPTKTMGTVALLEEQELAFALMGDAGQYGVQLTEAFEVAKGQTYTVNWDGTEYKCVCGTINSTLYIGNTAIMGNGDDTGEPFIYGYNKNISHGQFATFDTSATHTISVKTAEEVITPMAEEFLPANTKNTTVFYYSEN